jgi:hypothetical protein
VRGELIENEGECEGEGEERRERIEGCVCFDFSRVTRVKRKEMTLSTKKISWRTVTRRVWIIRSSVEGVREEEEC